MCGVKVSIYGEQYEESEELKCAFPLSGLCDGSVAKRLLFSSDLDSERVIVPICDKHFREHTNILFLHEKDYDVEKVLDMTCEQREEKVSEILSKGAINGDS